MFAHGVGVMPVERANQDVRGRRRTVARRSRSAQYQGAPDVMSISMSVNNAPQCGPSPSGCHEATLVDTRPP